MAYAQIRNFGFNENVGLLSFEETDAATGKKPFSKRLQATMDYEARQVLLHCNRDVTRTFMNAVSHGVVQC